MAEKKYWLLPVVLMFVLFGMLIAVSADERRGALHLHPVLACCLSASSASPPTTTIRPPVSWRTAALSRRRRKNASRERNTMRRFRRARVDYCLREAGITVRELDLVGFYEKPLVKFERLLETYIASAPRGFRSYLMAMPHLAEREAVARRQHP